MKKIVSCILLTFCVLSVSAQTDNVTRKKSQQQTATVSKSKTSSSQSSSQSTRKQIQQQEQASSHVQSSISQSNSSAEKMNDTGTQSRNNTTIKTKPMFSRDEVIGDLVLSTVNDYAELANKYRTASQDAVGQIENVYKAIYVYDEMKTKFPYTTEYANFMAARTIHVLDLDQKQGLAKPYYEALASSIEAAGVKNDQDKTRIKEAYTYVGIYYFKIKDDSAKAKPYFEKLISVDPDNALAKQVLDTY